ncbi:kinesin motor domain-containing protein [Pilobolus umbonatus]|nr:kinesin motor domain-containing protein [Pilobolus umbonatus]
MCATPSRHKITKSIIVKRTEKKPVRSLPLKAVHPRSVPENDRRSSSTSVPSIERKTNIQVYLRCKGGVDHHDNHTIRPRIEPVESSPTTSILLSQTNNTYNFDRVFYDNVKQEDIYNEVAKPMLNDVLNGLSCTIFAYGQTGTGKTYTMEGDLDENNTGAGIIPRSIYNLYELIKDHQQKFVVKVSMLELYNENLKDLLAREDKALKIYEDPDGLGIKVHNVEEICVPTPVEALDYMKSGVKNRKTAYTQCNDKSSRSHCIFTLTVYIGDQDESNKKHFKVGKLNLVDLAGSENSRNSGSQLARAREAANINKSLLALGRVINALVDNATHIPYRESNLTRLLKDSLGGYTKTCIIATISPKEQQLEEIRNTLEYGSHAKGILNFCQQRLQENQRKIYTDTLLQSILEENYKLRSDLKEQYERQGVYRKKEEDDKLWQDIELHKTAASTANKKLSEIELEMQDMKKKLKEMESKWKDVEIRFNQSQLKLKETQKENSALKAQLCANEATCTELSVDKRQLQGRLRKISKSCGSILDLCNLDAGTDSDPEESPARPLKKLRYTHSPIDKKTHYP